ncbi:MAG: hypothetical protein O7J95_13175, partial [Planctomycetota bacterium]|nr:hypothetical protein [Planctomycetota bacterium]
MNKKSFSWRRGQARKEIFMSNKHSSMARSLWVFSVTVVLGLGGGGRAEAHPELEWQQTFGGRNDDRGRSVQQTSDGGYVLCGSTRSFGAGEGDAYVVKTSPSGELEWQQTFGGTESDWGNSVEQTSDGGYVLCGGTFSFGAGNRDVYLVKLRGDETP